MYTTSLVFYTMYFLCLQGGGGGNYLVKYRKKLSKLPRVNYIPISGCNAFTHLWDLGYYLSHDIIDANLFTLSILSV